MASADVGNQYNLCRWWLCNVHAAIVVHARNLAHVRFPSSPIFVGFLHQIMFQLMQKHRVTVQHFHPEYAKIQELHVKHASVPPHTPRTHTHLLKA